MANFLDDLSIYNAKAAAAISAAVVECNNEKANMMSSLKTTANDITLSEEIRLNALTALINLGNLLDIPLPPYFPVVTTYALTETFVGVHNDLDGIQGGAPGEYYHLTDAERTAILNKASVGDITWAQLGGVYSDNAIFGPQFDDKQDGLVAPAAGTYFVKVTGSTVSYDINSYISTISGIAAGGELDGFYPDPTLSNAAVIGKVLTGWNGNTPGSITAADSILTALQKLNANLNAVIASPGGVASVALTNNAPLVFTTTTTPQTGAASLSLGLNTQNANLLLASPNGTNGLPLFRALAVADLPNSGVTVGTYGSSTVIPQIQVDAKGRITGVTSITAASGGQVNTVGLSVPGILSPSFVNAGTPSDPIITLALDVQTANYVWAGPETGADAVPFFRLLVEDDIPELSTSKITNLPNILNNFLTNNISDGSIWIGNTSNAAVPRVLSGDVTVTNAGVTAIGLAKVQYDMIQDVTTQTLLGNYELTDGPVQQITLSADFVLNSGSGVLSLAVPVAPVVTTKGDLLGHDLTSQQRVPSNNVDGSILLVNNSATGVYTDLGLNWVAMSGDALITALGVITIEPNAVTLGKMALLPANRIIGNNTVNPATPLALTGTEVTAMLDQFTTTEQGLVPASGGGASVFLNANGNWVGVTGTGTVTQVSVVSANGFAGSVANDTTTPAITLSLTGGSDGVLKKVGTAIGLATAGTDYIVPGDVTTSGLTMVTSKLLGRTTAGTSSIEAIGVDGTLSLLTQTLGLNLGSLNTWTGLQTFQGGIRIPGATAGFVQFNGPAGSAANQTYTLPAAYPTSGTTKFLTSDISGNLSWAPAGGLAASLTINSGGAGAASPAVYDGSTGVAISYNTVGAQQLNANLTSVASLSYGSQAAFVKMTGANTFSLDTNTYLAGTVSQFAVLVGGASNSVSSLSTSQPNKILISNGPSTNPGWTAASYLDATTQYGILYSSAANVVSEILPPGSSPKFLQWNGSGYNWADAGSGSGTVGTGVAGQLAIYNGATSVQGYAFGGALTYLRVNSAGTALEWGSPPTGGISSITLTMPSAFTVTPLTLTANGTFTVTGAGTVAQYIRGDGSLATFPTSGGGGSGVNYYLNGSVTPSPAVAGYNQMSRVANTGAAANFTANNTTGFALMAQFVTDANDPALLNIPAGSWDFNFYFSSSNNTGNPQFYVDLLKYDGTTFTPIATGIASAETITNGTTIDLYTTAIAVPSTVLTLTDRLVVRVYVDTDGSRTITFYTQGTRLAEVFTTFTTGLTALNGLTAQVQLFANGSSGTAPAFVSSTATHTLNIPLASAASVTAGLISKTEYDSFAAKMSNPMTAEGDIIYGGTVTGGVAAPQRLAAGADGLVLKLVSGLPSWQTGGGDVSSNTVSTTSGDFAVFADASGKLIGEPAAASLTAAGRATFNSGVDVGVSGTGGTTGTVVFRAATSNFTTALQQSTASTQTMAYIWPVAGPLSNGQVLSSTTGGQLSWASAGSGDMTLAGTQTVTGIKTFGQPTSVGQLRIAGNTSGSITLAAPASAIGTITFPNGSDTLAGFGSVNTFSAANTFNTGAFTVNSAATFSNTIIMSGGAAVNYGQLNFTNLTSNHINFGGGSGGFNVGGGDGPPLINARSAGAKIVIRGTYTSGRADTAIGWNSAANDELWISTATTLTQIGFYLGSTRAVWIAGTGAGNTGMNLLTGYNYNINSTKVVGARETGYVAFTGTNNKNTSYATGTVTLIQLAERVAALQASLTTHGLIGV